MFRSMLAGKSRRKAAILGGALVGVLTPLAAQASLSISLQLAPGSAGATQTVKYLTPLNTGADVPVYVYATVTGSNSVTGGTSFQGIDYAYYNVNFANVQTAINATLDSGTTGFTVDGSYAFNASGSQQGSTANTGSGILVGSTTALTDIAKPRTNATVNIGGNYVASPIWNNMGTTSDSYVSASGTAVSFLVETLEVKPGAFHASTTAANGQNYTKFTASVPNVSGIAGAEYAGANWYQDSTTTNIASGTSVGGFNNGAYTASTRFMTFEDTLNGDADGNGAVNISDFNILAAHFGNSTGQNWGTGDFDGNGAVNISDFNLLAANFGSGITGIIPTDMQAMTAFAISHNDLAAFDAAVGVPEPTSLGILALGGISLLARRRRNVIR
jgi:hypothetical protein